MIVGCITRDFDDIIENLKKDENWCEFLKFNSGAHDKEILFFFYHGY